ncbi:MAG TPA: GNAT family N-acetyltransferase [Acidimicrobiales bacterium]|nr:GNAT family N-acetyltransferase [Acidimicrobiales bacterium]
MIRHLRADDWDDWQELWQGYLRFYREELAPAVTRSTFDRLSAGADQMFGLVAERPGGGLAGFANALLHPSTWTTTAYCYLEDLFVEPASRGTGTARLLVEAVAEEARRRSAVKVYWHTQEFNGRARSLYEQVARNVSFAVYEMPL